MTTTTQSASGRGVTDAGLPIRLKRIGIPDCFCESGSLPYLSQRYRMDTASIVEAAHAVLKPAS